MRLEIKQFFYTYTHTLANTYLAKGLPTRRLNGDESEISSQGSSSSSNPPPPPISNYKGKKFDPDFQKKKQEERDKMVAAKNLLKRPRMD